MRRVLGIFLAASAACFAYDASISYFSRSRTVTVTAANRQNYVIVDGDVWKFARPDLADVRLYDGQSLVPHALATQSGGSSNQESVARVLNIGEVSGHTEFDLDVGGVNEYDRVRLQLDAKNFINSARVEGRKALNDRTGPSLGVSTLYDFTNEGLGSNSVLRFVSASFPYLHVRLAPGIRPDQVKGALVSNLAETKAVWSQAGNCAATSGGAKQTMFECSISPGMPVERLVFSLPASTVNFNRTVVVSDDKGSELARSAISRVRVNRGGQSVVSEDLAVELYSQPLQRIRVTVENGDDAPLPIEQVRPLAYERRIYFDPAGRSSLRLYYGDVKLEAPSYDYQKFFQPAPDAALAQFGEAEANTQFTGRPDDRPWSERHSALLWIAMLIAVAILGGLALRGLKSSPSPPSA